MKKNLSLILLILVIFLGVTGVVLYLTSSFWGLLPLGAAVVLWYIRRFLSVEKVQVVEEIKKSLRKLAIPLTGIAVSLVIGGVIMVLTGYNPLEAYRMLFYGGFVKNWHISVLNATPLIFTGLSIALAFQAGLFNIGAEGQYYMGAMAATWLGIHWGLPPVWSFFVIVGIFVLSGLASAAYNIVPAYLKVRTGAHEVITTMMLAHIARYLSSMFIRSQGGDSSGTHPYVTDAIQKTNHLSRFKGIWGTDLFPNVNYRLHLGILLAVITALVVWWLLNRTRLGFEIRAVGKNPQAARAQGISVGKNIYRALLFAGFLAGLAGVVQILGLEHKMYQDLNAGYGWNGISIALLAGNSPIGVIFAALLWGALDAGGQYMTRVLQIPNAIVEIIKGIIIFLIVAKYIYSWIGRRLFSRRRAAKKEAV